MTTEDYNLTHLNRLDDQLTREYGDNAPLIKAAIHWCITGDTVSEVIAAPYHHMEWSDLEDVCSALRDIGGLDDLCDKIERSFSRRLSSVNHYMTRTWGRWYSWDSLAVIDILLGNHGTETVTYGDQWDADSHQFSYSNTGESYATTIGYDSDGDWHVCSWADWVEEMETQEE